MRFLCVACGLLTALLGASFCFLAPDATTVVGEPPPQMTAGVAPSDSTSEIPEPPDFVDYDTQLSPALTKHCAACHQGNTEERPSKGAISPNEWANLAQSLSESHSRPPASCGPEPATNDFLQARDILERWWNEGLLFHNRNPER